MHGRLTVPDRVALVLAVLTVLITAAISRQVFENIPHIEDETAYVWQAQTIAGGNLTLPSPVCIRCFMVPFVVDYQGERFGKYPIAWPVLLAIGIRLGVKNLINPLLAGAAIWLVYRLGKKLERESTGLLAAFLTASSPFFLMNSSTLLSHSLGLFLSLAFVLAWLDATSSESRVPRRLCIVVGGLSAGLLALTRPLTAVGVIIPFLFHGLFVLWRGDRKQRRAVLLIGGLAALTGALHFLWQYAVTGDALLNPYTLWWSYDTVGFGPGIGRQPGGHRLWFAWLNLKHSLRFGYSDLFGWPGISWLFLPVGLIAIRKKPRFIMAASVLASLILVYMAYWIGSWVLGPRYYFEGIFSASLVSAAGIQWAAGKLLPGERGWRMQNLARARFGVVSLATACLIAGNLFFYAPQRIGGLAGLNGATRSQLEPFLSESAVKLAPGLIIVRYHESWLEYGTLLELSDAYLDTPLIFTLTQGPALDKKVIAAYPDRHAYYYDTKKPYQLIPK